MKNTLAKLRSDIDVIDEEIVSLIAKRLEIVLKVGEVKKEHRLEPFDKNRLEEVLKSKKTKAKSLGVSEKLVEKIFKDIHDESVALQKKQ